ncbi:MAG: two-component system, NtrC family, sensor histidine kinase HydH [Planctomycetota bacterium]|jgi:PAS domain S-box-containing protein|nr:two-component system, NtrC family, sensor histidine kinase HydH [Planctomycetota bacterium]
MIENASINTFTKSWDTELADAFHIFNNYTQRLEESYNQLQGRVKKIDREMAHTNARLKDKVLELDNVTKYLNSLLRSIHSGVIAVNLKGEVSTINKAAEKILKLQASDVIGKKVEMILKDSDGSTPLLLALESGKYCIDLERKIETNQGIFKWIESSVSLIKDANENTIGAVEVFRDLSEIRELETRLRNADKLAAIGAMAACIAHEIRNPLNGIEGFSALLARDFEDSDPRKKLVKNILQGTKNLNKAVTELLVFARPLRLKLKNSRISEIVDKTLFFVIEDMKSRGVNNIRVLKECKLDTDVLKCDPEKLQQAFLNLCLNAIQSMMSGGDLTVFTRMQGDDGLGDIQVGIRDTGMGIKKEVIRKIFDPFFTTKQEGSGLGLAIVNKIIEAHNGRILVESVEGKGTTFYINLPRSSNFDANIIDNRWGKNGALIPYYL